MVTRITSKNISSFTAKVKALQRFYLQGGAIAKPGDVFTMSGHNLLDALNRKLVEIYQEPVPDAEEKKDPEVKKEKEKKEGKGKKVKE